MYSRRSYKMDSHKYANCFISVYREEGHVICVSLESYATDVCGIYFDEDDGAWHVYCTGTYSQTTRKQIGWFARELRYAYAPCEMSYYDFKTIYESDIDSLLPKRLCTPEELGAAIRLADNYSANCSPVW